jgi:WbqC-like protein family
MIVAIHQPNFFPWLGYFNKMVICDTFVVLDHVEAMWRSTWLTRNRVLNAGQARWLTLPAQRSEVPVPATQVRIQWENRLVGQNLRMLEANYARHPHFEEGFDLVREVYAARPEYVADFNLAVIAESRRRLGLDGELVRSSDLLQTSPRLGELRASDLLIAICQVVGGNQYLSGEGSLGYIDPPAFELAGIEFWFQRFAHPAYPQRGAQAFVSHLSVLDALFNVGFAGVRGLIAGHARERVAGEEDPAPVLEAQQ